MHKIAVYGSLRNNEYNFLRMKALGKIEYIETTTLSGWDLYSLGPYPAINPGEGTIVVDIIGVDDTVLDFIRMMERGANYREETVDINGEDCFIYVYNNNLSSNQVPSGDWSDRLKNESYV